MFTAVAAVSKCRLQCPKCAKEEEERAGEATAKGPQRVPCQPGLDCFMFSTQPLLLLVLDSGANHIQFNFKHVSSVEGPVR